MYNVVLLVFYKAAAAAVVCRFAVREGEQQQFIKLSASNLMGNHDTAQSSTINIVGQPIQYAWLCVCVQRLNSTQSNGSTIDIWPKKHRTIRSTIQQTVVSRSSRMSPNEVRYDRKIYYLVIKWAHNFMAETAKNATKKYLQTIIYFGLPPTGLV